MYIPGGQMHAVRNEGETLSITSQYDENHVRPLKLATVRNDAHSVRLLLKGGVDVAQENSDAFRYAAFAGHTEVVQAFLEGGALAQTAVYVAAKSGHAAMLERLSSQGVDLAVTDQNGGTAAHYAAHAGHVAVLELLASKGVDLAAGDDYGRRMGDVAAEVGHQAVLEYMQTQ